LESVFCAEEWLQAALASFDSRSHERSQHSLAGGKC
jgi:hypothetical protein